MSHLRRRSASRRARRQSDPPRQQGHIRDTFATGHANSFAVEGRFARYSGLFVERETGLEPTTFCLEGTRPKSRFFRPNASALDFPKHLSWLECSMGSGVGGKPNEDTGRIDRQHDNRIDLSDAECTHDARRKKKSTYRPDCWSTKRRSVKPSPKPCRRSTRFWKRNDKWPPRATPEVIATGCDKPPWRDRGGLIAP